jgi:hypothetical protein
VTFAIGEYSEDFLGDSFDACVDEFLRRRMWSARHAPLCLPNVREQDVEVDECGLDAEQRRADRDDRVPL